MFVEEGLAHCKELLQGFNEQESDANSRGKGGQARIKRA